MKHFFIKGVKYCIHLQLFIWPFLLNAQFDSLANFRYYDKRGINVFESPKHPVKDYAGIKVRFGAGVAQQFQSLSHFNSADGKGSYRLYAISPGFTTAMANLHMDVQLAEGIRFNLVSYLSTRQHNGARLKAGYLQFDKLPFDGAFWDKLMKVITIKMGHMEINYGDAHFRRSDGGQAIYNPFIENYILDAFTTEIGAEVYARKKAFFAMGGISNGMIKGNVDSLAAIHGNGKIHKSPAIYMKGGVDKSFSEWLRIRLSCSFYHNGSSGGNTLFTGDRAGSNYYMVMEKADSGITYATNAFSGRLDPGFSHKTDAIQLNGFIKLIGLEFFATYEAAAGRTAAEKSMRRVSQYAVDWVFRFGNNESIFIASRYNSVTARLAGITDNVTIDRVSMSAGCFLTRNILLKGEVVDQRYRNFQQEDYRNEGKFRGFVIQSVIGF